MKQQQLESTTTRRDNLRLLINIDDRINIAPTAAYKSPKKTHAYKVLLKVAASIIITLFAQKIQEEGEEGKSKSEEDETTTTKLLKTIKDV